MKKYLDHYFIEYMDLTKFKPDGINLQEMFDHKFEMLRKREIVLRLVDQMEARQSKKNQSHFYNRLLKTKSYFLNLYSAIIIAVIISATVNHSVNGNPGGGGGIIFFLFVVVIHKHCSLSSCLVLIIPQRYLTTKVINTTLDVSMSRNETNKPATFLQPAFQSKL